MLNISVIDSEQGLESIEDEWSLLLQQSSSDTIFLTWEWIKAWWGSYGAGRRLWILKVERDGNLVGLAPFYQEEFRRFGIFEYRGVYLIGDGSSDSDYLDLISKRDEEEFVARSIVKHLLKHQDQWDVLFLNEIPESSPHFQWLRKCAGERRWYWEEAEAPCTYVALPSDWNEYLRSLKPRVRTKIRSLSSRLEQNFKVEFNCCERSHELESRLESLFCLHNLRWQEDGREGVFMSPAKRRFYAEMSTRFLERGWLRLYSLSLNGSYVAHQFCFEYRNRIFLLQEGFDPTLAEHGVGNVLRAYVFRDCIDRKIAVYDFLGGVTPHKVSWGGTVKNSIRGKAGRPIAKNRLLFELPKTLEMGKKGLKNILPETVVAWGRNLGRAGS
jgi:CelD/BcsL family acetyltransferase involved in cellulose biosynthesis